MAITMTADAHMGNMPAELIEEKPDIRYAFTRTNRLKSSNSHPKIFSPARNFLFLLMIYDIDGLLEKNREAIFSCRVMALECRGLREIP